MKLNPPNHQGQYLCGICAKTVHVSDFELDHILPRSSHPELKSVFDNLQPTHASCNRRKGSQHWEPLVSKAEYELRRKLDL